MYLLILLGDSVSTVYPVYKYVHTRAVEHLTAYAVKCVNCLKFLVSFFVPPSLKLTRPVPSNKDFFILISTENFYSPCKTQNRCTALAWQRISSAYNTMNWPIPVAARSKELVCCRSPAEIVGSNPTGGMAVCLF